MAKLADYYICDLFYTKEGYVIADEDEVRPNIYEDNDEYIKDEGKCMKDYIVVKDYICEPDRKPEVVAQFNTREQAEQYSRNHEGVCWVYEMSK